MALIRESRTRSVEGSDHKLRNAKKTEFLSEKFKEKTFSKSF